MEKEIVADNLENKLENLEKIETDEKIEIDDISESKLTDSFFETDDFETLSESSDDSNTDSESTQNTVGELEIPTYKQSSYESTQNTVGDLTIPELKQSSYESAQNTVGKLKMPKQWEQYSTLEQNPILLEEIGDSIRLDQEDDIIRFRNKWASLEKGQDFTIQLEETENKNTRLNKHLEVLNKNYILLEDYWNNRKTNELKSIILLGFWLWILDYTTLRLYLLNKITELHVKIQKGEHSLAEELSTYLRFVIAFQGLFPFNRPTNNENDLLVYTEGLTRQDMDRHIEKGNKKLYEYNGKNYYKQIDLSSIDNLCKIPYTNLEEGSEGLLEKWREMVKEKLGEFESFDYIDDKKYYKEKSYYGYFFETLEQFKNGIKDAEGNIIMKGVGIQVGGIKDLIKLNIVELVNIKHKDIIEKFIVDLNKIFKDLCEKFCINCTLENKLKKLNELFNVDTMNETELYKKHNISIRDLILYLYLNIIEYIEKSVIKKKYKKILISSIEYVILNHIEYSIWYFLFSNNYLQLR